MSQPPLSPKRRNTHGPLYFPLRTYDDISGTATQSRHGLGPVGPSVDALEADETPRTRDRLLVVVYLVLSFLTVLSLLDMPSPPRDCVSLQSAFQVADLHLCGAVPQSSPRPAVGR
jgi:hypothetical protein